MSFMSIGCSLTEPFKKNDDVEAVRTVFITKEDFNYRALSDLAVKKKITDAVTAHNSLMSLTAHRVK